MDPNQAQLRHGISAPSFTFTPNNKFRRECPPPVFASPPAIMNPTNLSMKTESVGLGVWSPPTSQKLTRRRPATIHETGFSYCIPDEYTSMSAWEPSTPMQSIHHEGMPQTYAVNQDFYPPSIEEPNWNAKPCEDAIDLQGLDTDMNIDHAYTIDEAVPILDLRYPGPGMDCDHLSVDQTYSSRRMSGSSFTLSTSGALSEMPSYEDFSATLSEAPSFSSDYPPPSNRNSLMSSTQLSPVASPRMTPQNRSETVRTHSRGRASPSPRPSMRSAPYSMDGTRSKRWSTGSYAPLPNRRPSPFVYHQGHENFAPHPPRMASRHSSPTLANAQLSLNLCDVQTQQHPSHPSNNKAFRRNAMLLPSHALQEPPQSENPPPVLSHGLFRMLQSNADSHSLHSHYANLSDSPDLYASLQEEQEPPPAEDMKASDPDFVPHEQELRFDGDLYTPRWVRGHGNKREGWCGICKPGRWLVLKNSAFWYDKSFTHGISAATGSSFQEPQQTRRMDGNPDVWEGLCGSCSEWIALVSSKKKGTTWFRHAYKCHTHPKIKDAPKRRRESSHTRAFGASTMAKPKIETPTTPQMTPASSFLSTPTLGSLHRRKTISSSEGMLGMI